MWAGKQKGGYASSWRRGVARWYNRTRFETEHSFVWVEKAQGDPRNKHGGLLGHRIGKFWWPRKAGTNGTVGNSQTVYTENTELPVEDRTNDRVA